MVTVKKHAMRVAVILGVLAIIFSSVGVTVLYFLQSKNQTSSQNDLQKQVEAQLKQQKEAQMQNKPLKGYSATPFNSSSISKLNVEILKQGNGPAAKANSTVKANYFGWTSDGRIFDSTNKDGDVSPVDFPLNGVIKGWQEGLKGIKQGSVVKLLIPSEQAYGAVDMGDGRPYGPLAFIVELVEVK